MKVKYLQSKKVLDKMKKFIEKVPENNKSKIEKNEEIINIVELILYFHQSGSGQGLKILAANQMLSIRITNFFSSIKSRK